MGVVHHYRDVDIRVLGNLADGRKAHRIGDEQAVGSQLYGFFGLVVHLADLIGDGAVVDHPFARLIRCPVDRFHDKLEAVPEVVVVRVRGHLVVFAHVCPTLGGLIDLGSGLLRCHAHLGFDDVQGEGAVLDTDKPADSRNAEFRSLEVFDHVLGQKDIEQAQVRRVGETVSCDGEQHHRHIVVPGIDGKGELYYGTLAVLVVGGKLEVAHQFSGKVDTDLFRVLLDLLPRTGRAFHRHGFDQLEVVDEVHPGEAVLEVVGGHNVIF